MILGVLAKIAVLAGALDLLRQVLREFALELADLLLEALDETLFHGSGLRLTYNTRTHRITRRQHPLVTRFRRLAARRGNEGEVLLDGEHLIADALRAGVPVSVVLAGPRQGTIAEAARRAGAEVYEAAPAVIDAASPVRTPGGVVAIAEWSPRPLPAVFDAAPPFVLGLVDVQDPGNLGGAVRAADALEAGGVLALDRSADPGGWKALRGAMGSSFRIAVGRGTSHEAIAEARRRRWRVAAAVARHTAIEEVDLTGPWLVLLGNEGAGLPDDLRAAADLQLSIPMRDGVESLNVAVTAALVAAEARRQRRRDRRN
jgi:TrmH family RNA methyltransferase